MKKAIVSLYLEKDFKKYLEKKAKEKGLTLNAYIRMLLIEGSK